MPALQVRPLKLSPSLLGRRRTSPEGGNREFDHGALGYETVYGDLNLGSMLNLANQSIDLVLSSICFADVVFMWLIFCWCRIQKTVIFNHQTKPSRIGANR
jgi:hypothetical protein